MINSIPSLFIIRLPYAAITTSAAAVLFYTYCATMAGSSFISAATKRLEGKVALITGGASGIGEITARVFAHHGAKVVIADVNDSLGHSVRDSLSRDNASFVHCDVTDGSQIKAAVAEAVSTYGKLDIMFNNAGITGPNETRIIDNDKADFERVLAVNVTGVFLGMKHAAQAMIPVRRGCIINTASISSGLAGMTSHAYTCAKHAVLGLTRNAAVELGQFGIRVNCLSPNACATPLATGFFGMSPAELEAAIDAVANLKGVTLKVEDVANAALFLAGDEARYVSGHNLSIDGGFSVVNSSFRLFHYPPEEA
ncbi:secoisolariciresinol dehydrogenase isoform X1 [Eucalyptus grandis]|uniref:secoisolariciresinol dehydrogenase isoform X1 n=2 Tax=Eucalyptus grandis TaxID=71139 RepID=UPI00192EA392|nr:secoisolariciresinol dehydrogenase isoform X1 [Eucalyptus grandis]